MYDMRLRGCWAWQLAGTRLVREMPYVWLSADETWTEGPEQDAEIPQIWWGSR